MTAEQKLKELGFSLPELSPPLASAHPYVISGSHIYLSGRGAPFEKDQGYKGKVGGEISADEAHRHARDVGLYLLALVKHALGDFARVKQVVKVFGMVNAVPEFTGHTQVINGCSDLFVAVLGERGKHARSAIGVASLPRGFAVEIEATVEFE